MSNKVNLSFWFPLSLGFIELTTVGADGLKHFKDARKQLMLLDIQLLFESLEFEVFRNDRMIPQDAEPVLDSEKRLLGHLKQ